MMNAAMEKRFTPTIRRRTEKIDWRRIAALDIESVAEDLDFEVLQENISSVAFCRLENEVEVKRLDPNFVKLFQLAQLIIEYLLYSQDYLTENLQQLRDELEKTQEDLDTARSSQTKDHEVIRRLKRELKNKKKVKTPVHPSSSLEGYAKCSVCHKLFVSSEFLESHKQRRHAKLIGEIQDQSRGSEREQLSEMRDMKTHLEAEMQQIKTQLSNKEIENAGLLRNLEAMNENFLEQISKQKEEIVKLKEELRKDGSNQNVEESVKEQLKMKVENQNEEITQLRKMLNEQSTEKMSSQNLDEKLQQQERYWQSRFEDLQKQHAEVQKYQMKEFEHQLGLVTGQHREEMKKLWDTMDRNNENTHLSSQLQELQERLSEQNEELRNAKNQLKTSKSKRIVPTKKVIQSYDVEDSESSTSSSDGVQEVPQEDNRMKDMMSTLKNNPQIIGSLRKNISSLMESKLEEIGVEPASKGLTDSELQSALANLQSSRKLMTKKHKNISKLREEIQRHLEEAVSKEGKAVQKTPDDHHSVMRPPTGKRQTTGHRSDIHQPEKVTARKSLNFIRHNTPAANTQPRESKSLPGTRRIMSKPLKMDPSDSDGDSSSSDSDAPLEETVKHHNARVRTVSGDKVSNLANVIEVQLSGDRPKPVGGIDVMVTNAKQVNGAHKAIQRQETFTVDNDDDTFSISSVEDEPRFPRDKNSPAGSAATSIWESTERSTAVRVRRPALSSWDSDD